MSAASANPAPPALPGLDLQEAVGAGGAGVVYRAVHQTLRREVAVKLLPAADAGCPAWAREPQLMAALAHPNVVAVHDAGQAGGQNYLVMEFMAGGSLRGRMTPGTPWPAGDALELVGRVAGALEFIHGRGVLHLDLKPENILYAADGRVAVSDFGLAVPHEAAGDLAAGRGFRGTLDYAAPEVRTGRPPDARFDVFSLATVAYELLTGRPPGRVFVPPSARNPALPRELDPVLRRGLARDPEDRFPTAAAFRDALAAIARPPQNRGPVRVALAALGILAVVVATAYLGRPNRPLAPPREQPDRLAVISADPADRGLFAAPDGHPLGAAEWVRVGDRPPPAPAGLPLAAWPAARPCLVAESASATGFVFPLTDSDLARRVVDGWADLLAADPGDRNLVKAGGFDGECLAAGHRGKLWRAADPGTDARGVTRDRPPGAPGDPALRLSHTDPAGPPAVVGAYQTLPDGPEGGVLVLRFRARSQSARGSLTAYPAFPLVVKPDDAGPAAARARAASAELPPGDGDPEPHRRLYRTPAWVVPPADWRTYLVVCECPPFPVRALHRKVVIDLKAGGPAADRAWVDDVALFVWQPGGGP